MSVEDVSYLHTHSVQDSVLFFADSTMRDQTHYPSPAEYILQFTEPIKLVTGVEIMDATIPCTMYAIDVHNDRLDIITAPLLYGQVGPTDAEVATVLGELGTMPLAVATLEADGTAELVVVDSAAYVTASFPGSVPPELLLPVAPGTAVFVVCVRSVFAAVPLTVITAAAALETDDTLITFAVMGITYQVAVDQPLAVAIVAQRMTSPTSSAAVSMILATPLEHVFDVVCYELRSTDQAGVSATSADAAAAAAAGLLCRLRKHSVHLDRGNYAAGILQTQLSLRLSLAIPDDGADLTVLPSLMSQTIDCTSRLQLAANTRRAFYVNGRSSTANEVLGFATFTSAADGGYAPVPFGYNLELFAAVPADPLVTPAGYAYSLMAPGIINLQGPRFITLRCPEIEQYMYSGMTHGSHSTGIGIFKLPSAGDVSNLRFDFTSLVRKPFHPIGRLTRLTLRFERTDGVLYDFKGANNMMLINVRFLSPVGAAQAPGTYVRSVLNPDYNPDFMAWRLGPGAPNDARERADAEGGGGQARADAAAAAPGVHSKQHLRDLESLISRKVLLEQQRYTTY